MAKMLKKPKQLTPNPTYKGALDALFKTMDKAPITPDHPTFKKEDDKENYETQLMFAYWKYDAALHHIENVKTKLAKFNAEAMAAMKKHANKKPGKNVVGSTASLTIQGGPATAFTHELSAFLAAIRSGLDFLAVAAAKTMPGVKAHSMHTFEGMAEKAKANPNMKTGPVLDVVIAQEAWLRELREYRDQVVHHLVVKSPAMGWLVSTEGKISKAVFPIVVPRKTPTRAPDTRRSRMMDTDLPHGLSRWDFHRDVTFPDGAKKTLRHEVLFEPVPTHVPILEMMEHHLSEYQKFSIAMFGAIVKSGFGNTK